MSRIASKVTPEELIEKFKSQGGIRGLFDGGAVANDLRKVEFDLENHDEEGCVSVGDLTYILCRAGGDWEYPVYFVVYMDKDGKTLRGYIPEAGNAWNKTTKSAYGNDEEADAKDIAKQVKKYRPELIDPAWDAEDEDGPQTWTCESLFNKELMKKDIAERITVGAKPVKAKPPKPVKCLIGKKAIKNDADAILKKHTAIILTLKPELTDRVDEIDPEKKLDWDSLILGWALGKGIPLEDAKQIFGAVGMDKLPKPIVDWIGPSWEVARRFVKTHPDYLLKVDRLSGAPLLYRRVSGANLSKGLTGKYDSNGRKIGSLGNIEIFVNWNDVKHEQ